MKERLRMSERVIVDSNRHPLNHFRGRVVGIRGEIEEGNAWILVFIPVKNQSFLIPETYLKKE